MTTETKPFPDWAFNWIVIAAFSLLTVLAGCGLHYWYN
jgi:hypothetical protein